MSCRIANAFIAIAGVAAIGTPALADETGAQTALDLTAAAMLADAPPVPTSAEAPFFSRKSWTGGIEFGLNGSAGNTEQLALRAGITAKRDVQETTTTFAAAYGFATSEGETSKNKFQLDARNDYKKVLPDRWILFIKGTLEYDQFQDWDWRLSGYVGVGYDAIKDDKTSLILRAGVGGSQTFGSSDDEFRPELDLGADLSHKLTERQKITATIDYYPALDDFPSKYRVVGKAEWEVLVDPEVKMSLKVGAQDRYDSEPGPGAKRNDIDYYALLVWSY